MPDFGVESGVRGVHGGRFSVVCLPGGTGRRGSTYSAGFTASFSRSPILRPFRDDALVLPDPRLHFKSGKVSEIGRLIRQSEAN